ncbi:MAG: hypothetical protein IJW87_02195 [Clostridia bacterium]|nr:hypothetical protein [Clostridia bacterium]
MEIKRRKIKNEEIFAQEQDFSKKVKTVCDARSDAFLALGYELDLEFLQKEHEAQRNYDAFVTEGEKKFDAGYVSRAVITVKRKKTEEELAKDKETAEVNRAMIEAAETAEEAEQLTNDETLRTADAELKRSVAFTEVMLVRVYKSFWTEWVSYSETTEQLEADLEEFLAVLEEKQAENA